MNITFIGTGYVGLVSGTMMAHLGHDVICIDVDAEKIEKLNNNIAPIYEPGLENYIENCVAASKIKFICGYSAAIQNSECVFVTVGTPPKPDGSADLSIVYESVKQALQYVAEDCVFVMKSTVPPGTCAKVQEYIKEMGFNNIVTSNPEFLREGSAIDDFLNPDRVVVGAETDHSIKVMREVYKPFTDRGIKLVETNLATSELIKYASNSFLATKIAFINEMADLCEITGADIDSLAHGIGMDNRIGSKFLKAGPGFGGSCFPKDISALADFAKNIETDCHITNAVIESNTQRADKMVFKIKNALGGIVAGKKIAIFGLTYKAGTDDLRCSPSIPIINKLQDMGADIDAYDPKGLVNADKYFESLKCADNLYEAAQDADIAVIITEWEEFGDINIEKLGQIMNNKIIVDLRNILNKQKMHEFGFVYHSIGRKSD